MKPISKRTYFFFCCIHLKSCTISLTHLPNIYKGHPLGLKALRSEKIVSFSDQCIPNLPHFLYSKQYREDMMYTPQPSARNLNIHLQIRRVITVQASTYCILVTGVRWRVITLWWVTSDQYVTACSACSACTRQILIAGGVTPDLEPKYYWDRNKESLQSSIIHAAADQWVLSGNYDELLQYS